MGKNRKPKRNRQINIKWTIAVKDKKAILQALGLTAIIAFLFYRTFFGLLVGVVVIPFWLKLYTKENENKRRQKALVEFKEYMMLIVASLQTGYSLERALQNAENEFIRLYTTEAIILPAIHRMNQKLKMNLQLEKAFMEFAAETEIEEANSLAEIISFAKRSGGDYGKNIRETALKIEENLAIKEEIETITTEKRLELKVMSGMPLGILAYITITSGSFIAPLYGNPIGIGLMSVCLVAYGFLVMLGRRIIEIRV